MRRLEVLGAVVELQGRQPVDHARELRQRVVGDVGIGGVALLAFDDQLAVERAAPADLDLVADRDDWLDGSPTMQASSFSPRALSQSSTLIVPLTEAPSSSPVMRSESEPFSLPLRAAR